MAFDLDAIMQNPQFQSGLMMLGLASPKNRPMLEAYQMLQQMEQQKQTKAQQEQMMRYREEQIAVEREKAAKYGEQNKLTERRLAQGDANRKMFEQFMQQIQPASQAPVAAQPAEAQQPVLPPVSNTFNMIDPFVAKTEGGYVANDAGKGPTNFGINQKANPDVNVKDLTPETAVQERKKREDASQAAARTQTMSAAQGKVYTAHQSLNLSYDQMFDTAKRLKNHPGLEAITGLSSNIPAEFQGANARNARAVKKNLEGQIFTNSSQAFRRMNETGGSVGQQSDWEGKQFNAAWAQLDEAQTTDEYQAALDRLMIFLTESKVRLKAAYDYYHGKQKGDVPPEKFKKIVSVGKGKKSGRTVIKFEDGSEDYAD